MKSRALRLTLVALFVGLLGAAAYIVWNEESVGGASAARARRFDDRARQVSRVLLDIKSAQPGYVAAGQGEDFWASRVDSLLPQAAEGFTDLQAQAVTAEARSEIEEAASTFDDFRQMDRRARDYARNGQRLLASDLVFSDGLEKIEAALAALERARERELASGEADLRAGRRAQALALAGAGALGILLMMALVPLPEPALSRAPERGAAQESRETRRGMVSPAAAAVVAPAPAVPASAPPVQAAPQVAVPDARVEPAVPAVDLPGVAALCTELSRVLDTRALPAALERAAQLLDASGIVIWIADPDGRELSPVMAHGYPEHLLARLGTIPRDAENVTAAAFRTGLVQTIKGDAAASGAVAAPLITPDGPVGVMAAEMLRRGEEHDSTRAVATILAAQLATLMGPPSVRASADAEAARA